MPADPQWLHTSFVWHHPVLSQNEKNLHLGFESHLVLQPANPNFWFHRAPACRLSFSTKHSALAVPDLINL